ncbi:MAG: potassium channel family protein, partial [Candidatus Heimdallarchaeota archaeon]|nr:potassium channel family protein [Candidatus Heimdallarchaeota archaeon]
IIFIKLCELVFKKLFPDGFNNESLINLMDRFPIRKILIYSFFGITISTTVIFKLVEDVSWITAIYFIIATISTVGFGDITAKYNSTRILTIVLIINSLIFLGLMSQLVINRIISIQFDLRDRIPRIPLDYDSHVILVGYGSKGRRLAQLMRDRTYKLIIVEVNNERAHLAISNGYEVIIGDITKSSILEVLSLKKALALFLLLSDDEVSIQTGMVVSSIAPGLNIYAEFLNQASYNIARFAGINKPISLSQFMTNHLQSHFFHGGIEFIHNIRDLKQQESTLGFVLVSLDMVLSDFFDKSLIVGTVHKELNTLHLKDDRTEKFIHSNDTHYLIAVDKEELGQKFKGDVTFSFHKRIIFLGYTGVVDEFISRFNLLEENITVIPKDQKELELLEAKKYTVYLWTLETGYKLLEEIILDEDLVICLFPDITSSLMVSVALRDIKKNVHLIQVVPYEYDIEPLMRVGSQSVITAQQVISDAMISMFLKDNNLTPSYVFRNTHVYEHLVDIDDFFDGKKISDLGNIGFKILYIKNVDDHDFREPMKNEYIEVNDRLLVYVMKEN